MWFSVVLHGLEVRNTQQGTWRNQHGLVTALSFRIYYFNYAVFTQIQMLFCYWPIFFTSEKSTTVSKMWSIVFDSLLTAYTCCFTFTKKNVEPVLFLYLKKFLISRASCPPEVLFLNDKEANNLSIYLFRWLWEKNSIVPNNSYWVTKNSCKS